MPTIFIHIYIHGWFIMIKWNRGDPDRVSWHISLTKGSFFLFDFFTQKGNLVGFSITAYGNLERKVLQWDFNKEWLLPREVSVLKMNSRQHFQSWTPPPPGFFGGVSIWLQTFWFHSNGTFLYFERVWGILFLFISKKKSSVKRESMVYHRVPFSNFPKCLWVSTRSVWDIT